MSILGWVITAGVAIVIAIIAEAILRRNRPRKPLSEQFDLDRKTTDQKAELGMEAIDINKVNASRREAFHKASLSDR